MSLTAFNDMPAEECATALQACCGSPRWARALADGRPYRSVRALADRSADELAALTGAEIWALADGHPRIGERPRGTGRHEAWSRREQAGVATADEELAEELASGNRDYEHRFGHVFLIRAAGRTGTEVLAALRARLGHGEARELAVVRAELTDITRGRLEGLIGS
ncbi:2-oxo-4-hydroxy-4-carboxy-5-ureidoimidazoline decarboxylase [Phytomonospora sp. NPDC050363]|uniref:2-oxo-4-hydroxy-4-carboxy-5-ureidoimidazoline decarboxylase n=1 Tax=Phytomonospora sp. NPDC050363 TaxID=3155642 RepID=UPI0034044FEB